MAEDSDALLSTLFRGSFVLLAGLVLELSFRLFGKVLIARVLGVSDFGSVALGITLTGVTATIVTVGMNTGIGRYLPREDDPAYRRGVLLSAVQIALPVAIVVGLLVALGAGFIATELFGDPAVAPVIRICGLAIPFAAFLKLAVGAIQGMKITRPKVYLQNLSLPISRFALFALAAAVGLGASGIAWAFTVSTVLVALFGVYLLARHTELFASVEAPSMHRELLDYSVPVMVRNAMTMLLVHVDTFLLGALGTLAAVGIYNAVYPLAMLVTVAHKAADFLYLPIVSELDAAEKRQEIGDVYRTVTKWLFVGSTPVFVAIAVFPRYVVGLTYGPEYADGALALTVLAAGFFVHTVAGINGGTLEAVGSTRFVMLASAVVAAFNVGLNLALIPRYSFLGAAVATTGAYLLLNAMYTGYLYATTGLNPVNRPLAKLAGATVVLVAALLVAKEVVVHSLPSALGLGLAFVACYGVVVLRVGLAPEDVRLLLNVEEEFGVDLGRIKRFVRLFTPA